MASFQMEFLTLAVLAANLQSFSTCFQTSPCPADDDEPWSYRGQNGPSHWGQTYPTCNGNEQSPIEINSATAVKDGNLEQLIFYNYDIPISRAIMGNTGRTIEVTPVDDVNRAMPVNGELYFLKQFHFHFGKFRSEGSEHTLNRVHYAMEMHLIHRNKNGDTAVVGIFFQEQVAPNEKLQIIVDVLPYLTYKDTEIELRSSLDLNSLLPQNPTSFYRYKGSLTTPECTEGVTWSIVSNPMPVGSSQMAGFRQLHSVTEDEAVEGGAQKCLLAGNYRPVQPLKNRKVYLSQ